MQAEPAVAENRLQYKNKVMLNVKIEYGRL